MSTETIQQRAKAFVGKYWPRIQEPTASDIYRCVVEALTAQHEADTQVHAGEVEQAQRAGNNLYLAIVHQMTPHTDNVSLSWDILPSTIKEICKERDQLRQRVADLEKQLENRSA